MTTQIDYAATAKADVARVIREARAARAEALRNLGFGLLLAVKRLFSARRPQAAH